MKYPTGLWGMFQLRPSLRRKEYYQVFIFDGRFPYRVFMRAQNKRWGLSPSVGLSSAGICRSFVAVYKKTPAGRWKRTPLIGQIALRLDRVGAGYIAHELTHAAIGWVRRIKMAPQAIFGGSRRSKETRANERFCAVIHDLNVQFWNKFYARQAKLKRR